MNSNYNYMKLKKGFEQVSQLINCFVFFVVSRKLFIHMLCSLHIGSYFIIDATEP